MLLVTNLTSGLKWKLLLVLYLGGSWGRLNHSPFKRFETFKNTQWRQVKQPVWRKETIWGDFEKKNNCWFYVFRVFGDAAEGSVTVWGDIWKHTVEKSQTNTLSRKCCLFYTEYLGELRKAEPFSVTSERTGDTLDKIHFLRCIFTIPQFTGYTLKNPQRRETQGETWQYFLLNCIKNSLLS